MLTDSERLVALEIELREARSDIRAQGEEMKGVRNRLHDVEGATAGLVTLQTELHRANEWRLKRITVAIALGSFGIAVAMFLLAAATYLSHPH